MRIESELYINNTLAGYRFVDYDTNFYLDLDAKTVAQKMSIAESLLYKKDDKNSISLSFKNPKLNRITLIPVGDTFMSKEEIQAKKENRWFGKTVCGLELNIISSITQEELRDLQRIADTLYNSLEKFGVNEKRRGHIDYEDGTISMNARIYNNYDEYTQSYKIADPLRKKLVAALNKWVEVYTGDKKWFTIVIYSKAPAYANRT